MKTKASRPLVVRTFMTHDMKDEDIAALSTGRDTEFRQIMNAIARSRKSSPGSLQHIVVYGSRGFGKSFMTRRVQVELTGMADAERPVAYALLPEEQHNLQRSPHAFLDAIALKLAETKTRGDENFENALFQWPKPGAEEKRWNEAGARLEEAVDAALPGGKGLAIAVVENFDILLGTLFKDDEDEQRLRRWLDRRKNRVMLLATATGTVDIDYERPLFKAFQPVRLSPWTRDDCIAYFNRQREHEGRPPLDGVQAAKARAIADFIGGTPRLAQLLAEVLDTQDALTVAETMSALADKLAEYYRRRIEDLPPLGRGLLDALIRGGEPASQTELAARVGADGQNSIARAMSDLQKADVVRGRPAPGGRETLYSVTDRVFVHYYRLRQGSRTAQATPLATILDFLKSFYSRDEQREQGFRHLEAGRLAEAGLFSRLAMEGKPALEDAYTRRFEHRVGMYLQAAPGIFGKTMVELGILLEEDPASIHEFCRTAVCPTPLAAAIISAIKAQSLYRLGHLDRAQEELEEAVEAAGEDGTAIIVARSELSNFHANLFDNQHLAAEIALRVEAIEPPSLPTTLRLRQATLMYQGLVHFDRYSEALDVARRGVELVGAFEGRIGESRWFRHLAFALSQCDRHEEALAAAERALALAQEAGDGIGEARSRNQVIHSLGQLDRNEEAIALAERGLELAREGGDRQTEAALLGRMMFSFGQLRRNKEALVLARQAADIAKSLGDERSVANALPQVAACLKRLGQFEEAFTVERLAAEMFHRLGDPAAEAEALRNATYSLIELRRHEEAAETARQSVELAQREDNRVETILSFRALATALDRLGRYDEAIEIAERAFGWAAEIGDNWLQSFVLQTQANALAGLDRHEDAVDTAHRAAEHARAAGDEEAELYSLRQVVSFLRETGQYEKAWIQNQKNISSSILLKSDHDFFYSAMEAVDIAVWLPRLEAVELYRQAAIAVISSENPRYLGSAALWLTDLFLVAARSDAFPELDGLLNEYGVSIAEAKNSSLLFTTDNGSILAKIADTEGRARAYEAITGLLPRIAAFMKELSSEKRDDYWLPDLMTGFATSCRDPILLRDVAGLLTDDLAPQAQETANLLRALADVDEAPDAEAFLARVDPDMETLIRRMRDLPDSSPPKPKRKAGRKSRQPS